MKPVFGVPLCQQVATLTSHNHDRNVVKVLAAGPMGTAHTWRGRIRSLLLPDETPPHQRCKGKCGCLGGILSKPPYSFLFNSQQNQTLNSQEARGIGDISTNDHILIFLQMARGEDLRMDVHSWRGLP